MRRIVLGMLMLVTAACAKKPSVDIPAPEADPGDPWDIDLAVLPIDSQFVPVAAGNYYVRIINLAPANTYAIAARVQTVTMPPLDLPSLEPRTLLFDDLVDACEPLGTALQALAGATDESLVPALIAAVKAADVAACTNGSLKEEAERRIAGTTRLLGPFSVQQGQVLNVTVARAGGTPRWARTYSAGERGRWVATYGFNFIWTEFAPNRRYFLEETGTAGTYEIRGKKSQDVFELAPTLFYTWMSADEELRDWFNGPTVGLGFDFEAPVVSAGWAWTYNQNATFSTGLSLHQVRRLNERYHVGQQVTTLIGDEELFRDVYRINPYIAVTIRSIGNPFQRDSGDN